MSVSSDYTSPTVVGFNDSGAFSNTVYLPIPTVQERILQLVRRHMPIDVLFNIKLRINLELLIQDQQLFYEIAQFVLSIKKEVNVTLEQIQRHFEGSEVLKKIQGRLGSQADVQLPFFYQAVSGVLNGKIIQKDIFDPIQARIFTLKNALIAQHEPERIAASQKVCGLSLKPHSQIQEQGYQFVSACLQLHLDMVQNPTKSSFREELVGIAEKLISFTRTITKMFLSENNKSCPDDPLTFRNPSGYNFHGSVAAVVMEACLNALGYKTRCMYRTDLEPKVTLATLHYVVEVIGPDGEQFVVDPSYIQFHKDVVVEGAPLPKHPVLILSKNEISRYVEEHIMPIWRENHQRFLAGDQRFIQTLIACDQLFSHQVQKGITPQQWIPSDMEGWVRKAFERVWDISTYSPVVCNSGFQTIFGDSKGGRTYQTIRHMNIAPLTHYLPWLEVERRLMVMERDSSLQRRNDPRALSLIAQLNVGEREKFRSFLDIDPRIIGVNADLIAYFRSLRKIVNPEEQDLSVIYGCAGCDCSSVMLSTDATEFIFVDLTSITLSEFQVARKRLVANDPTVQQDLLSSNNYPSWRATYLGAASHVYTNGKHHMPDLALKLLFDLRNLGVDLNELETTEKDGVVSLSFKWQYHESKGARKRDIHFVTCDITEPFQYPSFLHSKLQQGIDIFYMKGAFSAPSSYPDWLPAIAKSVRPNGWLMTTDKTFQMIEVDPDPCLKSHNLKFSLKDCAETAAIRECMTPAFSPFDTPPSLSLTRDKRSVGSDLSYWAILHLRQKEG